MAELITLDNVILFVVGLVLLLIFASLFRFSRAMRDVRLGRNIDKVRKRMKDPVSGTLTVTGISERDPQYSWQTGDITGVVSAPGLEPRPVRRSGVMNPDLWPKTGDVLPVLVDRAKPDFFFVEWVKVKPGKDAAWDDAQRLAAEMKSGGA
jgi:hypothetical protein